MCNFLPLFSHIDRLISAYVTLARPYEYRPLQWPLMVVQRVMCRVMCRINGNLYLSFQYLGA